MFRFSLFQRVVVIFLISSFMNLVFFFYAAKLSYAQEQKEGSSISQSDFSSVSKITSEAGFLSHKYFFKEEQLKGGKDFERVLSIHPLALKEYKRSRPYSTIALLGSIGMLVGVIKTFSETMKQADDLEEGNDSGWGDVTIIAISGGVTVVSSIISGKYFKKSIKIFNKKQERDGRLMKQSKSAIGQGIEFDLLVSNDNGGGIQKYTSNNEIKAVASFTYRF